MTVSNTLSRIQYTATASQTIFAYGFEVFSLSDLIVTQNGATLTEGTHYTVSGVGSDTGGDVTFITGATEDNIITIYRDMSLERLVDYQQNGDFLASDVNDDFDRLWLAMQQNNGSNDRSIRAAVDDAILDSTNTELTTPTLRANKVLGFSSTGALDYVSATINAGAFTEASTVASMISITGLSVGDVVRTAEYTTGNGGGGTYDVVLTSSVSPNNYNIIASAVDAVSFVLRVDGVVNAKQFGATGDGATDDRGAIQAAIDYAGVSGGTIYFQEGTYIVSKDGSNAWCVRNIQNDVSISGYDATLKCLAGDVQILRSDGGDNFNLIGLTVEGINSNGSNLGAGIIQINNGTGILVKDTNTLNSDQDGIAISTCTDVIVDNHTSSNDSKSGIYPNDCTNIKVINCVVKNFGGHLVSSAVVGTGIQSSGNTNCSIIGNIVNTGEGSGIRVNSSTTLPPKNNIVSDNIVINCANPTNTSESYGIRLTNGNATKAVGTIVSGNYLRGNALYNIYLENHNGATVEGNTLIESLREGVIVGTVVDAIIQNNSFFNTNTDASNQNKYDINLINAADKVQLSGNRYSTAASFATSYSTEGITDGSSGTNTLHNEIVNVSIVWQPNSGSAIATGSSAHTDITISGATFGDYILVSAPYNQNDCVVDGYVKSSGTGRITLSNNSGANRTFASGTWQVRVLKN